MRTMLKISMDVEAANEAIQDGRFQKTIQPLIENLQPEASYYTTDHGRRTAYVFFSLTDSSQIPQIAEPLFQHLKAELEFKPVMNADDLVRGLKLVSTKKAA